MKKEKSKLLHVIFLSNDKKTLDKLYFTDIVPTEAYIIDTSVERFSTDEPCIIYRINIIKNFQLAFYDYAFSLKKTGINEVLIDDIPVNLAAIDTPENAVFIRLGEGNI